MSASNNFITRPVLSTVCSLLIVIVGLIAIPILPIENLPDIAPPTVKVQATYVGADAVAVEQGVTSVLEQQINGVENMDFITSNSSSDGVSSISVSFDSGTDGNINQVNVQNRVSLAEPQLPEEVRKSGVTVNKSHQKSHPLGWLLHVRPDGPGSGDHGGLIHARALLDFRQVVDRTDHVRQGDLGILVEVAAARQVALEVDANRGPFGACAGEAYHHPAAVVQKDAQTLA